MDYTDLPKDLQEWGREIEMQLVQAFSDRALDFQAAEKEAGRTVSITDAVHHVKKRMNLPRPGDWKPFAMRKFDEMEDLGSDKKFADLEDDDDDDLTRE